MDSKEKEFMDKYSSDMADKLKDEIGTETDWTPEQADSFVEKIKEAGFNCGEKLADEWLDNNEAIRNLFLDAIVSLNDDFIKVYEPMDAITRGKVLREKREAKGYTQRDVAEKVQSRLGVDKFDFKRISDWEKGRIKTIPPDIKAVLYSILDIDEQKDLTTPQVSFMRATREDSVHVYYATLFADFVSKYVANHNDLSDDKGFTRNIKGDMLILFNEFLSEQADKEAQNK